MSTICIGNPNLKHTVESRFFLTSWGKGNWFELSGGLKNRGKITVFDWEREASFQKPRA